MTAKCKQFTALLIVFTLAACSGSLLAQKREYREFSLSAVGVTMVSILSPAAYLSFSKY